MVVSNRKSIDIVTTAESFVTGMNGDCKHSHWRQKPDFSRCWWAFLSVRKGGVSFTLKTESVWQFPHDKERQKKSNATDCTHHARAYQWLWLLPIGQTAKSSLKRGRKVVSQQWVSIRLCVMVPFVSDPCTSLWGPRPPPRDRQI